MLREQVRDRYAPAATAVATGDRASCCDSSCGDSCSPATTYARQAGATDVEITPTHAAADAMHSAIVHARKPTPA